MLIHKDLAEKNNLKVVIKLRLSLINMMPNNEKQADETIEVEIKGIFDGHNKGGASAVC